MTVVGEQVWNMEGIVNQPRSVEYEQIKRRERLKGSVVVYYNLQWRAPSFVMMFGRRWKEGPALPAGIMSYCTFFYQAVNEVK